MRRIAAVKYGSSTPSEKERERERERAALKIIFQFDCSDISSHPSSSLPSPTRSSQETPNRIHIFRPAPPSASATLEKGSSKIQTFLRAILLDRRITDNWEDTGQGWSFSLDISNFYERFRFREPRINDMIQRLTAMHSEYIINDIIHFVRDINVFRKLIDFILRVMKKYKVFRSLCIFFLFQRQREWEATRELE